MRPFQIIIDTNADTPKEYILEKGIVQVPQYTLLNDVTYEGAEGIDPADFYVQMKNGALPQSQAINPGVCEDKFRAVLDAGKDILYISFSSEMSGSYNTAAMTAQTLSEEYTDAKIITVDTLGASVSETLLLMQAVEMQEAGKTIDEVATWLEENKLHSIVLFTVDDLFHLQRGGRLSKGSAIMGSIINIKPMMKINDAGKLEACGKVRGRKKALNALVDVMAEKMTDEWKPLNKRVGIAHGNCMEDVQTLTDLIRERFGIEEFVINDINPSIGVHSGPGAIMMAFFGNAR